MQNDIAVQTRQRLSRGERAPLRPIFPLLSVLVIMSTGLLTLCVQEQTGSLAAGSNVASQPTLPAAAIERILIRVGSPMVGTGATIERMARATRIDDAFALAVWWAETNDGAAGVGINNRNPGSVRGSASYPGDSAGYTIYPSYSAAITEWFYLLKNSYIARGRTSVYAISGPYVGTAGAADWAAKVMNLMAGYRQEAPQPVMSSGPVPQRLLAVHTALSTQGTSMMQPGSTQQPQQPQRAVRAIENRNTPDQRKERQEFTWSTNEIRETEVHSIQQTARQTPSTTGQDHNSTKDRHATKETSSSEIVVLFNTYQLPLAGTLASLIVIIFLIAGRRSGKPMAVIAPRHNVCDGSPATEKLSVCQPITNASAVPPTPRLAITDQIPLTPLVYSQNIHDTEEFMLPHSLRTSSTRKHNIVLEEIAATSAGEASTEALSAFTCGLTLPVRKLGKREEMGITTNGLLSRYGDKTGKN